MTTARFEDNYAPAPDGATIGKYWWLPLVAGALSVVVGLIALFYPGPTLAVVGFLFGIYLALWGTMRIVHAVSDGGVPTFARVLLIILGLLGLVVGLVLMVRPGESVLTFVWVLGFWWVVSGVLQLVGGIAEREGRIWNIVWGLLGIVAGSVILAQPGIGLVTLVWIVGISLIVQGCIEIGAGFEIRRLHKEGVV
jgi:uncharacterized membrane protein HdeD (DUF308 family)